MVAATAVMPERHRRGRRAGLAHPHGPLINLDHTDTKALNAQWLNTLAEYLAAGGCSGRDGPTKNIDLVPEWAKGLHGRQQPLLTVWAGVTRPDNLPLSFGQTP